MRAMDRADGALWSCRSEAVGAAIGLRNKGSKVKRPFVTIYLCGSLFPDERILHIVGML
jgi:hypothetical protein